MSLQMTALLFLMVNSIPLYAFIIHTYIYMLYIIHYIYIYTILKYLNNIPFYIHIAFSISTHVSMDT